jgi:putative ABC transport system permease protein
MALVLSIIDQGLIFSLVASAVYLTSRVIKKDDLSVEGTFGLGGAFTAVVLAHQLSPLVSLLASLSLGLFVGAITGILYTKLKMNHLMAGLVCTTACFSLSLSMAKAQKNIAAKDTIFALIPFVTEPLKETLVLLFIAVSAVLLVRLFLRSELGLLLRVTGDNPHLLRHFGKDPHLYYMVGFAVANGLTALAGSLFVQWSQFFSITGNIGTLVTGLTSLMIAELISKKLSWTILLSSLVYQSIFAITLMLGLPPVWNNMTKACIIIALVAISSQVKSHA